MPPTDPHWGQIMGNLVVLGVILYLVRRWQLARRRNTWAAEQWGRAITAAQSGQCVIAYIVHAYQHARRGTKATIQWWPGGGRQDAWFPNRHVPTGVYAVMPGGRGSGYGPHNNNPNVFYAPQTVTLLPGNAPRLWERQLKGSSQT